MFMCKKLTSESWRSLRPITCFCGEWDQHLPMETGSVPVPSVSSVWTHLYEQHFPTALPVSGNENTQKLCHHAGDTPCESRGVSRAGTGGDGLISNGRGVWVPLPDRGPANPEACGHSDSGTGPPQAPVASGMPELAGWPPDTARVLSCL